MSGDRSRLPTGKRRQIRSYVLRKGRLTPGQRRALDELWPQFGVDWQNQPVDFTRQFGRQEPLAVEIGFGNGAVLAYSAKQSPQINFVGIEVHPPGIGALLKVLAAEQITNVRIIAADAVEVLQLMFDDQCISHLALLFPDPWPKKRHHKRRIIQLEFIDLLARKMRPGAVLHMATDWPEYADWMTETFSSQPDFQLLSEPAGLVPGVISRPETRFEQRGLRLGHEVRDLFYRRI